MESKYSFQKLTPVNNADISVYEDAIDFVFNNDDVKNVAISGAYSSGKSSILESYKKKREKLHFIHISLAHFRTVEQELNETEESVKESVLEGKILNQLIHQISSETIPQTNFRVKKGVAPKKLALLTIFTSLFAGSIIFLLTTAQIAAYIRTLPDGWIKTFISFLFGPYAPAVASMFCVACSVVLIFSLIKAQKNKNVFRKINLQGNEIEIFEEQDDSYFDKYLNEVLYLFAKVKADVIVFEDMDRFNASRVFERLHEVNRLTNIQLMKEKGEKYKPLRFFYLLRDDIFISKDRTKFFDFIIPIVPIVDGSNSFNKFIECFEKSGIIRNKETAIDLEFLQGLSLYIDDMRILQNICNEFVVYYGRLSTTEQDANKMLALITVKNLFPHDFASLQLGRGFVFEVIGGNGKERLIASEKAILNEKIEAKNEMLDALKNEFLPSDEIAILYHTKLYNAFGSYNHPFNPSSDPRICKQNLEQYKNNKQHAALLEEYSARLESSAENDETRAIKISALETEIDSLKSELIRLTSLRLRDIISRANIKELFDVVFKSETGNNDNTFNEIKDSQYFDLLKYLVREGFVDETYSDYMTYFYENSLSRIDKIFLRSITDKKAKEPTYSLDNPKMVISRIPAAYFEQEETLNYTLFDCLLADFSSDRIFADKTKRFIHQITENECFEFLLGYCENGVSTSLVKALGVEWNSFLAVYFAKLNIGDAPTDQKANSHVFVTRYSYTLLTLIGENPTMTSCLDAPSSESLVRYLSNDTNFLAVNECDDQKVALGIQRMGLCFKAVNVKAARQALFELVYENNSYVINYGNIEMIVKAFYLNADIAALQTANYSVIMTDADSSLSEYINANINLYMDVILAECNEAITDTPNNAISLLNNPDIDTEKKITYITYLKTMIANILDINDTALWSELFETSIAVDYSASNIMAYFSAKCEGDFDNVLVQYINSKGTTVTLDGCLKSDNERKNVFSAIVKSTSLDNHIYKGYLEQFDLCYPEFSIAELPYDKLKILDELEKIEMSSESLSFMREHYEGYLYTFIVRHIADYIKIVSETDAFLLEESLELLNADIEDSNKIALLRLDKTPISINGKKYTDAVVAHIMSENYDANDFSYMLESYSCFSAQAKSIILEKAINQIGIVLPVLDSVSRQLLSALFLSGKVTEQNKQKMFKALASDAADSEIKQWLPCVNSVNFLALYDDSKRPRFENNEWNRSLLEIFKGRELIKDYELSEQLDKLTITRSRQSKSKEEFLD